MKNLRDEHEIMINWKGDPSKPLASICCITYNHEKFIEDALEGFLIQETDFPFEILINDDASTDKTAGIIREYVTKYPKLIKPIYQTENKFSKGIKPNYKFNFPRVKSEYIALCEGDDYWTDPYKLQKQVDFLEGNQDYVICCHGANTVIDSDHSTTKGRWFEPLEKKDYYTLKDYISYGRSFIPTASILSRNYIKMLPDWVSKSPAEDMAFIMSMCLQNNGKIKRFPENIAVHKKHSGGVYSGKSYLEQVFFSLETRYFLRNKLPEHFESAFKAGVKNILHDNIQKFNVIEDKYIELNRKYIELNRKYIELNRKYIELNRKISQLINSYSYKIGRKVTLIPRLIKKIAKYCTEKGLFNL